MRIACYGSLKPTPNLNDLGLAALPPVVDFAEAISEPGNLMVFANVEDINDDLAGKLNTAARTKSLRYGIIPIISEYAEAVAGLIRPSVGEDLRSAKLGVHSIATLKGDFDSSTAGLHWFDQADFWEEVISQTWTAIAATTAGRQTYIQFGHHACLHPGLASPPAGVLVPQQVKCQHWFLQSCHSPFVWGDFGNYLSVPLALLFRGTAITVICSTHEQFYTPGLLALYMECARDGMPVGEIVAILNTYSRSMGVDYEPFVLFGNPDSRVVRGDAVGQSPRRNYAEITRLLRGNAATARTMLENLRFFLEERHFGLEEGCRSGPAAYSLKRLKADYRAMDKAYTDQLPELLGFKKAAGVQTAENIDGWFGEQLRGNSRLQLTHQVPRLRKILAALTGYYYHLGPTLGRAYLPESAERGDIACTVCGSQLLQRTFEYFGSSPARDYHRRTQLICSRCLVTLDWSRAYDACTAVDFRSFGEQVDVKLRYRNNSETSQLIFGFVSAVDPQNSSINIAPALYRKLLSGIKISPREIRPLWVFPGQTCDIELSVSGISESLFYLLIEVHFFINFCWNWLSFNVRRPQIERWLTSEEYRAVLPKAYA